MQTDSSLLMRTGWRLQTLIDSNLLKPIRWCLLMRIDSS